jgi:hypothetical protein
MFEKRDKKSEVEEMNKVVLSFGESKKWKKEAKANVVVSI